MADHYPVDNQLLLDTFFPNARNCPTCGTGIRQADAPPDSPFSCNCAKPPQFAMDAVAANVLGAAICNCSRWLLRLTFARQLELYDFDHNRDGPLLPTEIWACMREAPMRAIAQAGMHVAKNGTDTRPPRQREAKDGDVDAPVPCCDNEKRSNGSCDNCGDPPL